MDEFSEKQVQTLENVHPLISNLLVCIQKSEKKALSHVWTH